MGVGGINTDEQAILALFLVSESLQAFPSSSNFKSIKSQRIMISLIFGLVTLTTAEYRTESVFLKQKVIFFDVFLIFLFSP